MMGIRFKLAVNICDFIAAIRGKGLDWLQSLI